MVLSGPNPPSFVSYTFPFTDTAAHSRRVSAPEKALSIQKAMGRTGCGRVLSDKLHAWQSAVIMLIATFSATSSHPTVVEAGTAYMSDHPVLNSRAVQHCCHTILESWKNLQLCWDFEEGPRENCNGRGTYAHICFNERL